MTDPVKVPKPPFPLWVRWSRPPSFLRGNPVLVKHDRSLRAMYDHTIGPDRRSSSDG